ncbi:hypothetical protein [Silvanigrella aquatica]|uniref:Uncharacterized protein n=1 Tax=Silvanigrella aquatica TaxID=1915309 RepID=A0A1L4D377_9BACT|nr:hypothetical protein [Silvanigrella aquatica]APJ04642.1 hypothetical protein AXG55_12305 [Silvanigrella aquatica]
MVSSDSSSSFEYSLVVELFLELRGKGISLSAVDLDILNAWEESGIKPDFIVQTMLEYAEDCKIKSKTFPTTLLPLSKKVRSILIKTSEF